MKTCNCTLAGTSACKNCIMDFWTAPDYSIFNSNYNWDALLKQWNIQYKQYDSEKYDLVEKKDYKIKKLKEDIEYNYKLMEDYKKSYDYHSTKGIDYLKLRGDLLEKNKKLEQELQGLESKKKE